jgi:hypothetical protein
MTHRLASEAKRSAPPKVFVGVMFGPPISA